LQQVFGKGATARTNLQQTLEGPLLQPFNYFTDNIFILQEMLPQ
jgi:hypothetical protein